MWVIKGVTHCGSDKSTPPVSGLKGPNLVVTGVWRSSSDWEILRFVPADKASWFPQNDCHMHSVPPDLVSLSLDVSVQPLTFLHLKSKQNKYQGLVQLVFGKGPVWISVATVLVDNLPRKDERFLYGSLNLRFRYSLRSAHTVYLCVLCESENKQRLFPYTTLIDWFLWTRELTENT